MSTAGVASWRSLILPVVVLATGVLCAQLSVAGYVEDSNYLMPVTFTNDSRLNTHTNFPALVVLDTNKVNYSQFMANAQDLRFIDGAGNELRHEVESWMSTNSTASNSYIWVQIPTLTPGCVITAYWGNAGATLPAYRTNGTVWAEGYAGVWHMKEASAAQIMDSTANANNSSANPFASTASGMVGDGMTASANYATVNDAASLDWTRITFGGWFKPTDVVAEQGLFAKGLEGANEFGLRVANVEGYTYKGFRAWVDDNGSGGPPVWSPEGSSAAGQWQYVVATYDGSTMRMYVNGTESGSGASWSGTPLNSSGALYFGTYYDTTSYKYSGDMDEIRMATVARSANWIWAEYANMAHHGSFVSNGVVSSLAVAAVTNLTITNGVAPSGNNLGATSAAVTVSVTTNSGSEATGYLFYGTVNEGTNLIWAFTNELGTLPSAGTVTNTITNLNPVTTYYFMHYATNAAGQSAWGGSTGETFTTIGQPAVTTLPPANISWSTVTMNGALVTNGYSAAIVRVYWGTNDGGSVAESWMHTNEFPDAFSMGGSLSTNMTGVTPNVTNYYRFYATNGQGDAWASSSMSFFARPASLGTGGTSTNDLSGYRIHIFTNSGTLSLPMGVNADVLVVAGGGGGGSRMGGGGGGGGVVTGFIAVASGNTTVTVGAGGTGSPSGSASIAGRNGSNSVFGSLVAIGGGGGASRYDSRDSPAGSGGSGGGAAGNGRPPYGGDSTSINYGGLRGLGTPGQGYDGGSGGGQWYPAGGGGAGSPGLNTPGHGGTGVVSAILGTSYYWGGGGGGSGYSGNGGNGGAGGGGGGAVGATTGGSGYNNGSAGGGGAINTACDTPGGNAGANTGGGGGGGSHDDANNYGGNGGSGIVVVRYSIMGVPWIGNLAATNVTWGYATFRGSLYTNGASAATVRLYWGTNEAGSAAGNWQYTNEFGVFNAGADLSTNMVLTPGTVYYYRFYATNDQGETWAGPVVTVTPAPLVLATGGTSTNDISGYRIHIFTNSGTFTVPLGLNAEVLVVAGGGGGGSQMGGGGGGGGVIYTSLFAVMPGSTTVTVGAGGAGAPAGAASVAGSSGSNSVFGALVAIGGGG
ncbi:MAG: glycine-rich domain-containing protein, partial [bacterium]